MSGFRRRDPDRHVAGGSAATVTQCRRSLVHDPRTRLTPPGADLATISGPCSLLALVTGTPAYRVVLRNGRGRDRGFACARLPVVCLAYFGGCACPRLSKGVFVQLDLDCIGARQLCGVAAPPRTPCGYLFPFHSAGPPRIGAASSIGSSSFKGYSKTSMDGAMTACFIGYVANPIDFASVSAA